ncbi:VOC family protein [Flindersiella endophytica]
MNRVVHFEIHAADLDRAERFYTQVFGWSFQSWGGPQAYRLITTGPEDQLGIDGGMIARDGESPVPGQATNGFTCTIEVEDIGATEKAVADAGGTQVSDRSAVPGVGWLSYFTDTEGNRFGAMQADESAA